MSTLLSFSLTVLLIASNVFGHPGHDVSKEAGERAEFFKGNPKTLRACSDKLRARGHESANIARRRALAYNLRLEQGLAAKPLLHRRDFASYNFSHLADGSAISMDVDEMVLFADNSSCTLQSDVTDGPYYVNGELIRQNIVDGQDGIPLILDIQITDTSSCEPIPALYIDIWHCNSTGVYSGVVANGNGDSSDASNIDQTFLRGIQQTNSDGVVQFNTTFPGHYTGRATHIHVLTHQPNSTTTRVNRTLLGNLNDTVHASHVGQLFFDQDLILEVDTLAPYNTNTGHLTLNSEDDILASEADTTDPFVEYVVLGDQLEDGILAWISIGIDPTEDREISTAAAFYKGGGVANENGNTMGSSPNGTEGGPVIPSGGPIPSSSASS